MKPLAKDWIESLRKSQHCSQPCWEQGMVRTLEIVLQETLYGLSLSDRTAWIFLCDTLGVKKGCKGAKIYFQLTTVCKYKEPVPQFLRGWLRNCSRRKHFFLRFHQRTGIFLKWVSKEWWCWSLFLDWDGLPSSELCWTLYPGALIPLPLLSVPIQLAASKQIKQAVNLPEGRNKQAQALLQLAGVKQPLQKSFEDGQATGFVSDQSGENLKQQQETRSTEKSRSQT